MQFTRVELYNVGPYYGASSFEPSANPDSPITLISGMNGAGKTTIINALLLALYGSRSPAFRREGVPYSAYLERLRSRGIPGTECSYVMVDINGRQGICGHQFECFTNSNVPNRFLGAKYGKWTVQSLSIDHKNRLYIAGHRSSVPPFPITMTDWLQVHHHCQTFLLPDLTGQVGF